MSMYQDKIEKQFNTSAKHARSDRVGAEHAFASSYKHQRSIINKVKSFVGFVLKGPVEIYGNKTLVPSRPPPEWQKLQSRKVKCYVRKKHVSTPFFGVFLGFAGMGKVVEIECRKHSRGPLATNH